MDIDYVANEAYPVIQFTPPGSATSIIFGKGITSTKHGSTDSLVLAADDINAARADLIARGVEVSEVFHYAGGPFNNTGEKPRVGPARPARSVLYSFASFSDPESNAWLLQEITTRLPGRVDPPTATFGSANALASALRRPETAHGEHEKRTGQRDANWPRLVRHVHGRRAGRHGAAAMSTVSDGLFSCCFLSELNRDRY
jgi:hypothetical protein